MDQVYAKAKAAFKLAKSKTLSAWTDLEILVPTGGTYDARNPLKSSEPISTSLKGVKLMDKNKHTLRDVQTGDKVYIIDIDDIDDIELTYSGMIKGVKHQIIDIEFDITDKIYYIVQFRRGG